MKASRITLTSRVLALLHSEPERRWRISEIQEYMRSYTRSPQGVYVLLSKLTHKGTICRPAYGYYQIANGTPSETPRVRSDCDRVRRARRMAEYRGQRAKPLKCCKACHYGDGQNPPGTVTERGRELCCRMAVHWARAHGEEFNSALVLTKHGAPGRPKKIA